MRNDVKTVEDKITSMEEKLEEIIKLLQSK
jgi:hypothetical protein